MTDDAFTDIPCEPLRSVLLQRGYVTLREFASATGLTYSVARKMILRGELTATNISKTKNAKWRLDHADLVRYYERQPPATKLVDSLPDMAHFDFPADEGVRVRLHFRSNSPRRMS